MDTLTHPILAIDNIPMFPPPCDLTRRAARSPVPVKNVGDTERLMSAVGGAALALWGLSRFSTTGVLAAGLGAGLIYRGMTGHCPAYDALNLNTAEQPY